MSTNPIPRWKLERYLLGELPGKEMAAVERRIAESPETAQAVEDLRRSNAEFRRRFPSEEYVPRIIRAGAREGERPAPVHSPRRFRRFLLPAAPLAAAAAGLLLFVMLRDAPENRIKGGGAVDSGQARLEIYRKAEASAEILKAGETVRAGDLLQIAYLPAGKPFGLIASLDGRGAVTLHYPETASASTRLAAGPLVRLATSYELDDAPDFECFYFLTSDAEIDVRGLLKRISASAGAVPGRSARRLDLPPGLDQFTVCLRKGLRP
ncbi:MAG: hypothetical protein JW843_12120 [Candidatus Aminicenantes bacterium]|nr:hypothetical protein [Candidatus Aminicenantes bacterium]